MLPNRPDPKEYPLGFAPAPLWTRIKRGDFAGAILWATLAALAVFALGYNIGIAVGRSFK